MGTLVAPWLFEGVLIVVSVVLGFAVAQFGENRANRQLVQRALTSLQAELEYNLLAVEPYYDLIAGLSEIYQMQDHLGDAAGRVPISSQVFFDPRDRVASVRQTQAALSEMVWAEQSLVTLYRKQLPALQAATRAR